ncbi:MAG: SBBP repeat-containing protein, partial [candidate division WOR-3 bacterium]
SHDKAVDITVDNDLNVYVTGISMTSGVNQCITTIKYNSVGNVIWVRTYDGFWDGDDYAIGLSEIIDNEFYVLGSYMALDHTYDYLIIKYNTNGDTVWVRTLSGIWGDHDYISDFVVDNSGNLYITGTTNSAWTYTDFMTVKFSPNGDIVWTRVYNHIADKHDEPSAIAVDSEGNIYVTGKSWDYTTGYDFLTVKYDSTGELLWVERYNGIADSTDEAKCISVDTENNVYISGITYVPGHGFDICTIKYSSLGETLWVRNYGGSGHLNDSPTKILLDTANCALVVTGTSFEGTNDYLVIKYSLNGEELWSQTYNGTGNGNDMVYDASIDFYGNVYIIGSSMGAGTSSDYAILKYHTNGYLEWITRYNGIANGIDRGYAIYIDSQSNLYAAGESQGFGTGLDYLTIKYTQNNGVFEEFRAFTFPEVAIKNSVFKNYVEIQCHLEKKSQISSIKIFDTQGRLIKVYENFKNKKDDHRFLWNGKDDQDKEVPCGVYYIELESPNCRITRKIVKLR